jgi:hypothetical protein
VRQARLPGIPSRTVRRVSITKRVCDRAGPGEVFVSETVKTLLVGSGITTSEQGTYVRKGVPDEWRLYAIDS